MSQLDLSSLSVHRDAERTALKPRRFWMSRYVLPLILLAGVAVLIVWSARDYLVPPTTVTTIPVYSSRGAVTGGQGELFKAAGWIEPRPTPIRVAALEPGVVRRLLVVEDQTVAEGDPVAELVDADAQLDVRRATADLKLQEAELDVAKAALASALIRYEQPVHLQADLSQAEAELAEVETEFEALPFELKQATAQRDFAKLDYERKLDASDSVSRRAVDEAKSVLESSEAAVSKLQQREQSLRSQQASLSSRRDALQQQLELLADETRAKDEALANVKAGEARVEQARVALDDAELRLSRMTITAPVAGRVYRLFAHPGASVGASMTSTEEFDGSTVITMYQPESLQVRADVRFENLPQVRLGQRVEISNPAIKQPLSGQVLFVSSEADIQKNTLEVKIAIEAPSEFLRPEMLVDATFFQVEELDDQTVSETTKVFAPRQLVAKDDNGSYVWVADQRTSRAQKVRVTTGIQLGDLLEITSGLNSTHQLIDSNTALLRDHQRIRIVKGDASETQPATDTRPRSLPQSSNHIEPSHQPPL